jgi:hypothetical protein
MPSYCRLASALLALGLLTAPAYAATNCPSPGAKPALAALQAHALRAHAFSHPAECQDKCLPRQSGELMLLADDIPAPHHLPVVSGADEVASWHAEIFERLSGLRDDDSAPRYCQVQFQL